MPICECFADNFRQQHILSRVDARVKTLVTFALLLMVISSKGMFFPIFIAVSSLSLCIAMRIPLRHMFIRFAQPMFIALVVLLLKLFFTGQEVLFTLNLYGIEITGHKDGLLEGMRITSRVIGGVSLVIALGFAAPFTEFVAALSWLKVPRQFTEIMMFAYRYLFVFLEEAVTIYQAQKNRLGYAGIKKGLHSFGVLTGALVLRCIDQSQKTSEAMELRGYTGDLPLLMHEPLRHGEVAFAVLIVAFGGVIWMI